MIFLFKDILIKSLQEKETYPKYWLMIKLIDYQEVWTDLIWERIILIKSSKILR
jgi:hypothetical protein